MVPSADRGQTIAAPTAAKTDEVLRRIKTDYPYPTSFAVLAKIPTFLDIALVAKVYLKKGYSESEVREQVLAALDDYFSLYNTDGTVNKRVDFGYYYESGAADNAKVLPLSDLMNAFRDCPGIHRLGVHEADFVLGVTATAGNGVTSTRLSPGSHTDIPINAFEFPRLQRQFVSLLNGATNAWF
jgi:hypothetical protein